MAAKRALIFDVDGVLVDTSRSFPNVVFTAIQWWSKYKLNLQVDCRPFGKEHYKVTKNHPSFNDDYDIAWAFLAFLASKRIKRLSESRISPLEWGNILSSCKQGDPIPWVLSMFGSDIPKREEVRKLCEEIYFGSNTLQHINGRLPQNVRIKGLWHLETPNITAHWSSFSIPVGIYTGRSRSELQLALEILGWSDLPKDHYITSDTGISKPSPEGFYVLSQTLKFENVYYFGDTQSDLEAFKAYGRGKFFAIGNYLANHPNHFNNLKEALDFLLARQLKL